MEEPKPPRRISDAPYSKTIKQCYIPAYRDWPSGCGPQSDQSQPSDQLPSKELEEGEIMENEEGQIRISGEEKKAGRNGNSVKVEGRNGNYPKGSEVYPYPPPKRRGVVAYRDWPPGCGTHVQIEKNNDLETNKRQKVVQTSGLRNDQIKAGMEREELHKGKGLSSKDDLDYVGFRDVGRDKIKGKDVERESNVKGKGFISDNDSDSAGFKDAVREKFEGKAPIVDHKVLEREKTKDEGLVAHKEVQRRGEIKPVKIKIICGQKMSESLNPIGHFSKSPAEVAKEKREKSQSAEVAKEKREKSQSAEVAKEKRENSESAEAAEKREKSESSEANANFSKCPAWVAKEKREKANRLNIAPKLVKIVAKKRVGIKRKTDYHNSRFNVTGSEELEAVATQAIIQSQNFPFKITPKKSVSHPSFGTGANAGTSRLTLPRTDLKKNLSKMCNNNAIVNSLKSSKKPTDPRARVKRCSFLFQIICRKLLHEEETGNKPPEINRNRIDLRAASMLKQANEALNKNNPIIGAVPGVNVGDEYRYRAELSILGLHRPPQAGIDFCDKNGVRLATSIVASGGYSDAREYSDLLIYTGAGGQPNRKLGRFQPEDQKLERGNLALKNSMEMKSPVRVIHGVNTGESGKVIMSFAYDGLYMVERLWRELQTYEVKNQKYDAQVFKFQLRRIPGQPELTWNKVARLKRSKDAREGLCVGDISGGKEKMSICAINTIDAEKPPVFKYITRTIYPSWYGKTRPKGCKCKGRCSESKECECVVKNGGEIPFNFNGAIIQAKPLIYECGPACRCSNTCPNRVSQHGIQIPLEIFKTEIRGWGVRSLNSIASGTFVCEYVGELLKENEANERENDEYLFEIGHNYDDVALWGDLPSFVPGLKTDGGPVLSEGEMEGFTIDAAKTGNVGRFINHSCSPNLYAQNVLFDHDDKKMPHIMFFTMENIPPLQELTYHYNYKVGTVHDCEGNEKSKDCYCGSSECQGRLY